MLNEKVIDLEVDNDLLKGLLVDKESELYNTKAKLEQLQKEAAKAEARPKTDIVYIQKIAELEAELKFKDDELIGMSGKMDLLKEQKRTMQTGLEEKIDEYKERANQAYQAQLELKYFKDRTKDYDTLKSQNDDLKQKVDDLTLQLKSSETNTNAVASVQKTVDFFKDETSKAKKECHSLKLELDRQKKLTEETKDQLATLQREFQLSS